MVPVETTNHNDPREKHEDEISIVTHETEESMETNAPESNVGDMPAADDLYDED